jgi:uncharacterized membrane protein YoaK (UPF0700 family)
MHEIVELVRALAWPLITFIVVLMFRKEIRSLLRELPSILRRVRSAHALGVELELDKIEEGLPQAELRAPTVSLPLPETFKLPGKTDGGNLDAEP